MVYYTCINNSAPLAVQTYPIFQTSFMQQVQFCTSHWCNMPNVAPLVGAYCAQTTQKGYWKSDLCEKHPFWGGEPPSGDPWRHSFLFFPYTGTRQVMCPHPWWSELQKINCTDIQTWFYLIIGTGIVKRPLQVITYYRRFFTTWYVHPRHTIWLLSLFPLTRVSIWKKKPTCQIWKW